MVASNEAEKSELLKEISSLGRESDATKYWKIRLELVSSLNERLLGLLKFFSGFASLPPLGTESYLSMLKRERNEFLQTLSKECAKRRIVEEQLLDVQEQLRQLQMNYDRLINPLEQVECACAMQDETDLTILRDALNVAVRSGAEVCRRSWAICRRWSGNSTG